MLPHAGPVRTLPDGTICDMRMSAKAEYAVRAMVQLATVDDGILDALRDRFGTEVLFPPGMPKLLVRTDGSVELLPLGDLLSADEIAALVTG